MKPLTFAQWKELALSLSTRADRLEDSIRNEARALSVKAGLDPNLLGIHPHNAMIDYERVLYVPPLAVGLLGLFLVSMLGG